MLHMTSRPFVAVTSPDHLSSMHSMDPGPLLSALLAILAAGQEVPDHIPPATLTAAAKAAHAVTQQAASAAMWGSSTPTSLACTATAARCSSTTNTSSRVQQQQEQAEHGVEGSQHPTSSTGTALATLEAEEGITTGGAGDDAGAGGRGAGGPSSEDDNPEQQATSRRLSRFDSLKAPHRSILVHSESGLRSSRGASFKRVVFNPEGDEQLLVPSQDSAAATESSSMGGSATKDGSAASSDAEQLPAAVASNVSEPAGSITSCSNRAAADDEVQERPPQFRKMGSKGRGSFSSDGSPLSPSGREMWPAAAAALLMAEAQEQQAGEGQEEGAGEGGSDLQQQEHAGRRLSRLSFKQPDDAGSPERDVVGSNAAGDLRNTNNSETGSIRERGSVVQDGKQCEPGATEQLTQVRFDAAAAQAACQQNFPQLLQLALIYHHTCSWLWSTLEDPAAVAAAAGVEYNPQGAAAIGLRTEANSQETVQSEAAAAAVVVHARSPSPPLRSSTERAAAAADANIRLCMDQLGTLGSTATAMGLNSTFSSLGPTIGSTFMAGHMSGTVGSSLTATNAMPAAAAAAGVAGQLPWTPEATARKGRYCKPARSPVSTATTRGAIRSAAAGERQRSNTVLTSLTGLRVISDTAGSIECILSSWDGSTAGISRTASLAGILQNSGRRSCSSGGGLFAGLSGGGQGGEEFRSSQVGNGRRSYLGSFGGFLRSSLSGRASRGSRGGLLEASMPQLGGDTAGSVVRLRASAAGGRSSAGGGVGGGVELGGWWWGVGPDSGVDPGSREWELSRQRLAAEGHLLVAGELTQGMLASLQAEPRWEGRGG